jgi:hypothetical protein
MGKTTRCVTGLDSGDQDGVGEEPGRPVDLRGRNPATEDKVGCWEVTNLAEQKIRSCRELISCERIGQPSEIFFGS